MTTKLLIAIGIVVVALMFGVGGRSDAAVNHLLNEKGVEGGQTLQWSFDKEKVGSPPAGAHLFSGTWAIKAESDAPSPPHVLCQTGSSRFPTVVLSDKVFTDVSVSTKFKPVSGSEDRAAGIIFRVQDENNFYILRANALEDNINIYRYVGGSRQGIKEGTGKVPSGKWQELRVEVKGNNIRGYLNGKLVVEANDDTFKSGKIGLWTKADSVTCFDDVKVTAR